MTKMHDLLSLRLVRRILIRLLRIDRLLLHGGRSHTLSAHFRSAGRPYSSIDLIRGTSLLRWCSSRPNRLLESLQRVLRTRHLTPSSRKWLRPWSSTGSLCASRRHRGSWNLRSCSGIFGAELHDPLFFAISQSDFCLSRIRIGMDLD